MSCVVWLVYNNCVYFSRATIFDHKDLAEYLISLVNKAHTHTHARTQPTAVTHRTFPTSISGTVLLISCIKDRKTVVNTPVVQIKGQINNVSICAVFTALCHLVIGPFCHHPVLEISNTPLDLVNVKGASHCL